MKKGGRTWQFLGCSVLILLFTVAAQAGTLNILTTPFIGNDSIGWGPAVGCLQSVGCVPPNGVGTSFHSAGNTINVSFASDDFTLQPNNGEGGVFEAGGGGSFEWQIGTIFVSGTFLLGTNLNTSLEPNNALDDTMTLTFTNAVNAVGAYIQDFDQTDSFSATVFANGDSVHSFTEGPSANGNAFFIGIYDTSGTADINSISFTTSQPASGGTPSYFVIGTALFNDGNGTITTIPEPATLLMMGGGLAVLAWKARKRVRA